MGYLGYKPADKPLTSADITDGIIVNADIANSTIDLTTKVTGTLPTSKGGTGLATIGTASQLLRVNSGATALEFATVSGTTFGSALFHVRDEKAANSHGGSSVSGSFQTRVLNTTLTNEISGASLSSNQITLPSGTYYINARMPFYNNIDYVKVKLRNITDSSDTIIGTGGYMYVADTSWSEQWVIGRFTIASQKTFELQYRCGSSITNIGLGHHATYTTEVYSDCQIWKVA